MFVWAPATPHIMTGGSDGSMLLWDVGAAEADGDVRASRRRLLPSSSAYLFRRLYRFCFRFLHNSHSPRHFSRLTPVPPLLSSAPVQQGGGAVPLRRYAVKSEINAVAWGHKWQRHVALAFGKETQVLHI